MNKFFHDNAHITVILYQLGIILGLCINDKNEVKSCYKLPEHRCFKADQSIFVCCLFDVYKFVK